ncbi:dipicolinic acid synthetase [Ruminococcaceae bacterium OttesenSCG-928-N02]|nr:dipicolinic acid synthetase [Ruminococcaceae bacterium OttesenSCG-928-N02]
MERQLFWVAPGDARQVAVRNYLAEAGHTVTEIEKADYLVLPMPFLPEKHGLRAVLAKAKPGAVLFAGSVQPQAYALAGEAGFLMVDYLLREELTFYNAIATAEGAILLLLQERKETLFGAHILIVGYGRIGKVTAHRLLAFGAKVTVAARRPEVRAEAQGMGCNTVTVADMGAVCPQISAVVNTVPGPVLTKEVLEQLPKTATVYDLASAPGGVDFAAASVLGIEAGLYPALPAKYVPVSAGAFVARSILEMIEENKGVFS